MGKLDTMTLEEQQRLPIGVFDSGVGGLTVMTVLKAQFPHEDFIYIGDNANNPVGNKPPAEITDIALNIGRYLENIPVKCAIVACNTFTVIALEALQSQLTYPLIGVCKGVHTAIDISPRKKIGVMATTATINSHKHKVSAQMVNEKVEVFEQACPDFAHLIEAGHITDRVIEEKAEEYLENLLDNGVDTIILGCTHFPFIKRMMERITKHDIVYVDPAYETAEEVKRVLAARNLFNPKSDAGKLELCFTKDIEMAAKLASCLIRPKEFSIRDIKL